MVSLEEKLKSNDVTEDQLMMNFKEAYDEAGQCRNMILQLEICVRRVRRRQHLPRSRYPALL
uniref:Uncharacterized protein n=1 Tax=Physcomitrium patens TaxID=3218 RepID=A0A2K1KFW2_PHYPA|nr:hypothetical protein PHYPA_009027 [Physcomitrium patens]